MYQEDGESKSDERGIQERLYDSLFDASAEEEDLDKLLTVEDDE